MTEKVASALTRITRLYPAQLAALAFTSFFTGVFALSNYSDKVPEPMDLNSIIHRVNVGFYGDEYEDFAKVYF